MTAEILYDVTLGDKLSPIEKIKISSLMCNIPGCNGCKDVCDCYNGPKEQAKMDIIILAKTEDVVTIQSFKASTTLNSSTRLTSDDSGITEHTFHTSVDLTSSIIILRLTINDNVHNLVLESCQTFS